MAAAIAAITPAQPVAVSRLRPRPQCRPSKGRHHAALGELLFTQYLLPFEIVSVLLLVAMVGVILLSKKDLTMNVGT